MNRASLAATTVLTVTIAAGALLLVAPIVHAAIPATEIRGGLFPDQHQRAETLLFALAFAVAMPLSALLVPRLADRIAAGPNAGSIDGLAAALLLGQLLALLAAKASDRMPWEGGATALGVAMAIWCLLAAVVLARAAADRAWPALGRLAVAEKLLWCTAAALAFVAVLAHAVLGSIDVVPLLIAGLVACAALAAYLRRPRVSEAPRGRWGVAFDAVVLVLIVVSVPNLVVIDVGDPTAQFETQVLQFHQNFLLGPAAQVINGGAMLVDTVSQYGVGSIYAIAGWLALTEPTNGMVGLVDGLLIAAMFAGGYAVLRLAGVPRILAAGALAVCMIVLVWGLLYPVGGLLQHGAIRFGLPMGVLVAGVVEARSGRGAAIARWVAPAFVGLSSIWALEAFGYTVATWAAIVAVGAWLEPRGRRAGFVLRRGLLALGASAAAHIALALATLVLAGELPDWGMYLQTLREFLSGEVGDLTYDFSPWSAGLAVGAVYLASGCALLVLIGRRPDHAARVRAMVLAIAGSTAWGIALFSYLVNRSADHIVAYVSLPAVLVIVLWLWMLLREREAVPLGVRVGALALSLAVSALTIGIAWSSASVHLPQSAVAYALPGGKSLGAAIDRLADFPPIRAGAPEAEALLEAEMPGEHRTLIVADPDLTVEVLARMGRISELPMSDPWEDSLVPDQHIDGIAETVAALEPGRLVLLDETALETFNAYEEDPELDPMAPDPADQTIVPTGLATLQQLALDLMAERFELRVIARSPAGPLVAELVPRDG